MTWGRISRFSKYLCKKWLFESCVGLLLPCWEFCGPIRLTKFSKGEQNGKRTDWFGSIWLEWLWERRVIIILACNIVFSSDIRKNSTTKKELCNKGITLKPVRSALLGCGKFLWQRLHARMHKCNTIKCLPLLKLGQTSQPPEPFIARACR